MNNVKKITGLFKNYEVGFNPGHYYLTRTDLDKMKTLIAGKEEDDYRVRFEKMLAELIGEGEVISYAAGRMAFYDYMVQAGIQPGDEVIVPAFTCAVMINAIFRRKARPVYCEISDRDFGLDIKDLQNKATAKTKLVVAQHTLGIPCDIEAIAELCQERGLRLLEDCALTLSSEFKGRKVGTFGDAAIFSLDHSKPLNTMIGGALYSRDTSMIGAIREKSARPELGRQQMTKLWEQIAFERKWLHPSMAPRIRGAMLLEKLVDRNKRRGAFLEDDCGQVVEHQKYPYPAGYPQFLAYLGTMEIERWEAEKEGRVLMLKNYLDRMDQAGLGEMIPSCYRDEKLHIVPLRFVLLCQNREAYQKTISSKMNLRGGLFQEVVVYRTADLQQMGYQPGSCRESEKICRKIVNWPCAVRPEWRQAVLDSFQDSLSALSGS